jgi:hypothetical protein
MSQIQNVRQTLSSRFFDAQIVDKQSFWSSFIEYPTRQLGDRKEKTLHDPESLSTMMDATLY